ncbi:hypothetical protein ACFL28_03720 [Candidatus Omnitrophota bacterium]
MKGILVIMLTFCFLVQPYCNVVLAKNEDATKRVWGNVKEISNNSIVVAEFDYDTHVDIDVAYNISSDTKVSNIETLDDISIGALVEIEYLIVGGKREIEVIFAVKRK